MEGPLYSTFSPGVYICTFTTPDAIYLKYQILINLLDTHILPLVTWFLLSISSPTLETHIYAHTHSNIHLHRQLCNRPTRYPRGKQLLSLTLDSRPSDPKHKTSGKREADATWKTGKERFHWAGVWSDMISVWHSREDNWHFIGNENQQHF